TPWAAAVRAFCRRRTPRPVPMLRREGQGARWRAEPWFAFESWVSPLGLGQRPVRSSEVRKMNTLATRTKPRFIPASAARQGIAERAEKEGAPRKASGKRGARRELGYDK